MPDENLKKLVKSLRKISFKIIDVKFVKKSTISVISIYVPLLIIAIFVASIFGEQGYSLFSNWISDLGSINYTPLPLLYDIACIVAGTLTIPFSFYIEQFLAPLPETEIELSHYSKLRLSLSTYALFFSLIGNIGYVGVGIFSEDRNYFNLHLITSALAFGGFTFAAFLMGLIILFYDTPIPKHLGIYGIFGPTSAIILFLIISQMGSFLAPFFEWMLLFSILLWIIPLSILVFYEEG